MSSVVIFPVGKETSADDYLDFCNANNPDAPSPWYPEDVVDAHGQRMVAYLGPTFIWQNDPFPEPTGGPAARADGVLVRSGDEPEE